MGVTGYNRCGSHGQARWEVLGVDMSRLSVRGRGDTRKRPTKMPTRGGPVSTDMHTYPCVPVETVVAWAAESNSSGAAHAATAGVDGATMEPSLRRRGISASPSGTMPPSVVTERLPAGLGPGGGAGGHAVRSGTQRIFPPAHWPWHADHNKPSYELWHLEGAAVR